MVPGPVSLCLRRLYEITLITCLLAGAALVLPVRAQAPATLFRTMAPSDPNNDANWDFWTNRSYRFYYYKDGAILHTLPNYDRLPYYTQSHTTSSNNLIPDTFPADGWMLVKRDFGTPTAAPALPYFILYNKYRGILRVFMLNTWGFDNFNQFSTTLGFNAPATQTQYHGALLTFTDKTHAFLKDYDPGQQVTTLGNMKATTGWGYFDFILSGYDPTLKTKPFANLDLKTNGLNVANIDLVGNIYGSLEQQMNNAPVSFSRSDMETMEAALGKGFSYYKSTDDAMKNLKKATEDPSNANAWWISAATQIVAGFYTGGASYVPWIAGAVGFVSEFIGGGDKAAPMQPLNMKVQLALKAKGTITSSTWLDSPGFYLNYTSTPQLGQVVPVQPIPWGVFNVDEIPEVTVQPEYKPRYGPINPEDGTRWVYPVLGGYKATTTKLPGVTINPETGMATQSVKYAFTYNSLPPSGFVDSSTSYSRQRAAMPTGRSYELKFILPNASSLVHSDPVQVFYKTVPIKIIQGEPIGWFEQHVQ